MKIFTIRYLSYLCLPLILSCTNLRKNEIHSNVQIKNESLKAAIMEYDSILHVRNPEKDYLLLVYERQNNDSVVSYSISYELGTASMQNTPVSLAEVEGIYVAFVGNINNNGILVTDSKLQKSIARRYFPKEYADLKNGKSINCYITNDDIEMHLTFLRDSLIAKKVTGKMYPF